MISKEIDWNIDTVVFSDGSHAAVMNQGRRMPCAVVRSERCRILPRWLRRQLPSGVAPRLPRGVRKQASLPRKETGSFAAVGFGIKGTAAGGKGWRPVCRAAVILSVKSGVPLQDIRLL